MQNEKIKLFLVDDDALFLKTLEIEFLEHADFDIETYATSPSENKAYNRHKRGVYVKRLKSFYL